MATEGNKRYLQYILLLGKCSTIVLKGLLSREVRRKETTLEILLDDHKDSLARQLRNTQQFHHIFPPNDPVNVNLDTWDISLLAKVILLLKPSSLTWNEKAAVRLIKDMRNELFAHSPMMSFEAEDFDTHWGDLCATLKQLMSSLESTIQEQCEGVINKLENGIESVDEVTQEVTECRICDEQLIQLIDTVIQRIKSEVKPLSDKIDECAVVVKKEMEKNTTDIKQEVQSTSKETQKHIENQTSDIQECIELKADEVGSAIHAAVGTASETIDNIEGGITKANVQLENVSNETRALHTLNENIHHKVDALSEQICENTRQSQAGTSAVFEKLEGMDGTLKMLCEQMSQLQRQGKDFQTPQVLDVEIEIKGPTKGVTAQADEQLIKAFENVMTKVKRARLATGSKLNTELDKLVQQFKDNIERLDGVEIQEVQKHCVLVTLNCSSVEGMIDCVNYMLTVDCVDHFERMACVLSNQFGRDVVLKSHVIAASVQKALDNMEYIRPVKQSLKLPVRFQTLSGLQQICGMFTGQELQETLRDISSCLTGHCGRRITVQGRLNVPQIRKALNEIGESEDEDIAMSTQLKATAKGAERFTPSSTAYKIKNIRTVNVRLKDDRIVCGIYRFCQTTDGCILMADYNNQRLKRMNASHEITDFCNLPGKPWGVCDLGNDEAVVALNNNSLQFVTIGENITLSKSVRFTHSCWSLSCHGGRIFIKGGDSVYSYNTSGGDKRKLYTEPTEDAAYQNIKVSDSGDRIYIANDQKGFLAIDMDGNIVGKYEDLDIERVDDICNDGKGNLYICDKTSSIISQIEEDTLIKVGDISDNSNTIHEPWVMCFNRLQPTLIIGHSRKDTITVVDLTNR